MSFETKLIIINNTLILDNYSQVDANGLNSRVACACTGFASGGFDVL